jgi:hypothetical protein
VFSFLGSYLVDIGVKEGNGHLANRIISKILEISAHGTLDTFVKDKA